MQNSNISLKDLLTIFSADVDIFLLQDEAQENDLDKLYTKDEIREQLEKTLIKITSLPVDPKLYNIPLFPALSKAI
jgi:hypothetical protein